MFGTPRNPSDEEAIRRLLAESGVESTEELDDALHSLREAGREPAPAPCAELEALFTAGVTPLRKPSRRRGFLLGGAVIAAMAAGTTGVAASGGDFWVTAETSHEMPAPAVFEPVPAPTPAPVPELADVPAIPVENVPVETVPAETIPMPAEASAAEEAPAEPAPATDAAEEDPATGQHPGWQDADRGQGSGREMRGGSRDDDAGERSRDQRRQEQGKEKDARDGASYLTQFGGDGSRNHGGNSAWGPGSR